MKCDPFLASRCRNLARAIHNGMPTYWPYVDFVLMSLLWRHFHDTYKSTWTRERLMWALLLLAAMLDDPYEQ